LSNTHRGVLSPVLPLAQRYIRIGSLSPKRSMTLMRLVNSLKVIALSGFLTFFGSSCSQNSTEPRGVSLKQAEHIILTELLGGSDSGRVVYELPTQIGVGAAVYSAFDSAYTAPMDSWFFFIDDKPGYRWVHPCRYSFVCCLTGNLTTHDEVMFPHNLDSLRVVVFR
jgi:hypothetical protein